jgi:hypothetical protein
MSVNSDDVPGRRRGAQESIYPYETRRGTRYRVAYRHADGRQYTVRGFFSRDAAREAREALLAKVRRDEFCASAQTFGGVLGDVAKAPAPVC